MLPVARRLEQGPAARLTAIALLAVALLAPSACSSSGAKSSTGTGTPTSPSSTTSTTTRPRVLPGHTAWVETFVDTSRPTVPVAAPRQSARTLVTSIYRPNGTGPFPLIMFSHGLSGHPRKFTKLLSVWADAGFAVAAPAFPLTNDHVRDSVANVGDAANQAADLSFVLDKVLALGTDRGSRLFGAIDADRIGAGGLSLGGYTTYEAVYGACCRDNRFKAAEVLDGFHSSATIDGHVPILIAHSDTDPAIPYASARKLFAEASPPAWFVTLHGASHASEWENDVTPYDHIDERLTTDFWQATLKAEPQAFIRLRNDATVPNVSSIQVKRGYAGLHPAPGPSH